MSKESEIEKDPWECDGCAGFNPKPLHECPLMSEGYGIKKPCNCCESCKKECEQSLRK